jgi:transcriptional regulator with XRE-family HTH domain
VSAKKSAVNVALGEAMRSARRERDHSQESLARLAGIDRSYYGAVERGEFNVSLNTIMRLANALGVSAAMLFARARL